MLVILVVLQIIHHLGIVNIRYTKEPKRKFMVFGGDNTIHSCPSIDKISKSLVKLIHLIMRLCLDILV